jgi:hypothetical protein
VAGVAYVEPTETTLKEPERKKVPVLGAVARRRDFLYTVDFEFSESVENPRSGVHVAVYVSKKK